MKTIKTIYKVGMGPSSSHTMGPNVAARRFAAANAASHSYRVTLYGSLAATGKGHLTDQAIISALSPKPVEIIWEPSIFLPFHPNAMDFESLDSGGNVLAKWRVYSIGGGDLAEENVSVSEEEDTYPHNSLSDILEYCKSNDLLLHEYIEEMEGPDVWDFLMEVWGKMTSAIKRGLHNDERLPGVLNLPRKARYFSKKAKMMPSAVGRTTLIFSYALACSEENASGGVVVTAPTCGSSGVLPAVLYDLLHYRDISERDIVRALGTAGLIGNLARTNASISGAEVGCQGEVGVACAMASAAVAQLIEPASLSCVEYAAEMGIEHHLGLTCDPVAGLVQIPCIERNAMAAVRALECAAFSVTSDGRHRVRFDQVINVMNETGRDLQSRYKETAAGGLAAELAAKYIPANK